MPIIIVCLTMYFALNSMIPYAIDRSIMQYRMSKSSFSIGKDVVFSIRIEGEVVYTVPGKPNGYVFEWYKNGNIFLTYNSEISGDSRQGIYNGNLWTMAPWLLNYSLDIQYIGGKYAHALDLYACSGLLHLVPGDFTIITPLPNTDLALYSLTVDKVEKVYCFVESTKPRVRSLFYRNAKDNVGGYIYVFYNRYKKYGNISFPEEIVVVSGGEKITYKQTKVSINSSDERQAILPNAVREKLKMK